MCCLQTTHILDSLHNCEYVDQLADQIALNILVTPGRTFTPPTPGRTFTHVHPPPPQAARSGNVFGINEAELAADMARKLAVSGGAPGATGGQELVLRGIGLRALPGEAWQAAPHLTKLDLSNNQVGAGRQGGGGGWACVVHACVRVPHPNIPHTPKAPILPTPHTPKAPIHALYPPQHPPDLTFKPIFPQDPPPAHCRTHPLHTAGPTPCTPQHPPPAPRRNPPLHPAL